MKASQLHVPISLMTDEERELARQCAQLSFTPSSSAALANVRNGLGLDITWKESQIAYLTNKEKQIVSKLDCNASSAEKLIESFNERKDVNYLYVTFSPTEGLLVMSSRQKKDLKKEVKRNKVDLSGSQMTNQELAEIYKTNQLGNGGRLLLIFMFASNEEMRLVRMYPEFCACDTTFGTNKQKKELFTLGFLDAN